MIKKNSLATDWLAAVQCSAVLQWDRYHIQVNRIQPRELIESLQILMARNGRFSLFYSIRTIHFPLCNFSMGFFFLYILP